MLTFVLIGTAQTALPSRGGERWKRLRYGTTATGSTYVPLDSWIYSALGRLIALGYIDSAYLALRPWTRLSCVRMLARAEDVEPDREDPEAQRIFRALRKEFEPDYRAATNEPPQLHVELDSLYERSLGIVGPPLNDSFHFGQTLTNDYGRPFQEGWNQIAGFGGRAEYGRFSLSVRGEYQYSPGRSAYPDSVREAIAVMDTNPVLPATSIPATNTFRLIDANLSANLAGNEISVGKSQLWWGPAEGGAFAYSDNSEPIYMFRINRAEPLLIPWVSKVLGPIRYDLFVGSLKGHISPRGAWIQGQKLSFKPTPNFEFGVSRTIIFAGKNHVPLTFGSFWNSFTSFSNVPENIKVSRNDPGARYSSFDFSYRLPFVRNWLTLYTDALVHDDVSPLSAPRRAAFRPGIYLSHFPKFSRLDFRGEAAYTDFPTSRSIGGQFFFYENQYHDAYTNKQFILGDWIGREGKGGQAWLTYHLSPQEMVQAMYRNAKSAKDFVPGGTTQNDFSVRLVRRFREKFEVNTFAQIEFWKAPILAQGLQRDLALGLQVTYFTGHGWSSAK
ncbi:MAG: capsule assembly Wzi family protein [Bryobacteraceae bacterium]